MTVYSTDVAMLESLVNAAARVGGQIENRIATIEQRVSDLHIGWHGDAAQQHRANTDQWKRSMSEMRSALHELRSSIEEARTSYLANAEHNRRMWP